MQESTLDIVRSALKGDASITPAERVRILALIRNSQSPSKPPAVATEPCLIRRKEAARRLGCCLRLVDRLAHDGILKKRKLPGCIRASGFLESDLNALIESRSIAVAS